MSNHRLYSNSQTDRVMTQDQFTQVVDAILDGKYSWACVLILRFAGYNPLHYIPYRTYNRLVKDNGVSQTGSETVTSSKKQPIIRDIGHLEYSYLNTQQVNGGRSTQWLGPVRCYRSQIFHL